MKKLIERYRQWVAFGKKIARVQTKIIFFIAYGIIIVPLGLLVGKRPAKRMGGGWRPAAEDASDLASAQRQF